MDYKTIIEREKAKAIAEQNVKDEVNRNKVEILRPFYNNILGFLEEVIKDKSLGFSGQAHAKKGTGRPLIGEREFEYFKKTAEEEMEKGNAGFYFRTNALGFSFSSTRISFRVDDNFEPMVILEQNFSRSSKQKEFKDELQFMQEYAQLLIKKSINN